MTIKTAMKGCTPYILSFFIIIIFFFFIIIIFFLLIFIAFAFIESLVVAVV